MKKIRPLEIIAFWSMFIMVLATYPLVTIMNNKKWKKF
jgi:hypothetical protein